MGGERWPCAAGRAAALKLSKAEPTRKGNKTRAAKRTKRRET